MSCTASPIEDPASGVAASVVTINDVIFFRHRTMGLYFNGDLRATSRQFRMAERSNVSRRPRDITRWAAFRVRHRPDVAIADDPTPSTNRVFVVADRRA